MSVSKQALPFIDIERVETATDEVCQLIGELEGELAANYPPEQRHGLAVHAIFQPHLRFFVARSDGHAVGCGGIALFADFAEVKRMYVQPASRGTGVAEAIMNTLIAETSKAGVALLRLETGTQQMAAIRFYQRCGFQACSAFEPYSSMPAHAIATSLFLEKSIRKAE